MHGMQALGKELCRYQPGAQATGRLTRRLRSGLVRKVSLALACIVLAAGVVALIVWTGTGPAPRIDLETRNRVKPGMTLAEVEALIGAPPGDYASWTLAPWMRRYVRNYETGGERHTWIGNDHSMVVTVDENGAVRGVAFFIQAE